MFGMKLELILADLREAYFYLSDLPDKEASLHAKGVDLAVGYLQLHKELEKQRKTLTDSEELENKG